MTDEMNKAPEGVVLPTLDDRAVIEDLLRAHAMAVAQRLAEANHKNVPLSEVVQADQRAAAFIAGTLLGKNPSYQPAQVNTPAAIEKNLRAVLADHLKLYEIKDEEIQDPTVFMQAAMFIFTNKIHELINELKANPDSIQEEGPVKLNALISDWTNRILGK